MQGHIPSSEIEVRGALGDARFDELMRQGAMPSRDLHRFGLDQIDQLEAELAGDSMP